MGRRSGVLLVVSLVVAACGDTSTTRVEAPAGTEAAPQVELQVAVDNDIEYTTDRTLDVYYPDEKGSWPIAVLVHGYDVARYTYSGNALTLAAEGMVVLNVSVTMDYYDEGDHLAFPTSIAQEACAIRFARATAAEYGGDPSRIVLVGHSAGASTGIVAAMAGDEFTGDCAVAEGSALPDAFVGYEGPYNWSNAPGPLREGNYISPSGMWEQIDPYEHIGGNPTLAIRLVHGDLVDNATWDVPLQHSEDMQQALAEAGYDVELVVIEDANHMAFSTAIDSVLEMARG